MAIKRILVPFDGSKHAEAAMHYAFDVAHPHDAEIEGLGLVDVGPIDRVERGGGAIGGFAYARDARLKLLAKAQGQAGEFQKAFVELCRKEGVAYEYKFDVADPIARITDRSLFADLVVMGKHTDFDPESESLSCDKLRHALAASPRPFLAVPVHPREVHRAFVALDFGRTCSRLLFGLAHTNPFPQAEFTLLHVGDDAEVVRQRLADAAAYLAAHGIKAAPRRETGKAVEVLPLLVKNEDVDLVVLGGNAGGRISEFFFGSVIRVLLEKGDCPILTIH